MATPSRGTVGILDDAEARIVEMCDVLDGEGGVGVVACVDAADFLVWLETAPDVLFVSLDHDLGPSRLVDGERRDPGIGMDVARRLAELTPRFPVIVHSSNPIDAPRMEFLLLDAGWEVHRVTPHDGEAWIASEWAGLVRGLLGRDLGPTPLLDRAAGGPFALVDALERLVDLHERGALTDEEFAVAKAAVLGAEF